MNDSLSAPATCLRAQTAALTGIVLGHTNQQVAGMLNLSTKTVESYKSRLMTKLGLTGRAALVRIAHQRGLLDGHE